MNRRHSFYALVGAALGLGVLVLLPGCGGGGGGGSSSSSGNSSSSYLSTSNSAYANTAGTYTGTYLQSDNSESGTATITLASNGAVTGQLLSGNIGGQAQSGFPVTLTGNFELYVGNNPGSTGTLNITGTSSPSFSASTGNFTITGATLSGQNGTTAYTLVKQPSGGGMSPTPATLVGSYKITSITDPGLPSFACPGSISQGGQVVDSCTSDDVTTLSANGAYTSSSAGVTQATGTWSVSGTTITVNYTLTGGTTPYTDTLSFTISGNTLTSTRLTSTQTGNSIGTVTTFTKQ